MPGAFWRNVWCFVTSECPMKCYNCGKLNKTSCKCFCAPGWDNINCASKVTTLAWYLIIFKSDVLRQSATARSIGVGPKFASPNFWGCEGFLPKFTQTCLQKLQKKDCIWFHFGRIFSNQSTLSDIFAQINPRLVQNTYKRLQKNIFRAQFFKNQSTSSDFAKVFTHFVQISTDFARILKDFARIFTKPKFPAPPPPTPLPRSITEHFAIVLARIFSLNNQKWRLSAT